MIFLLMVNRDGDILNGILNNIDVFYQKIKKKIFVWYEMCGLI